MKRHILCSITFFFSENCAIFELMQKQKMIEPKRLRMKLWRMRIPYRIPKATILSFLASNVYPNAPLYYVQAQVAFVVMIVMLFKMVLGTSVENRKESIFNQHTSLLIKLLWFHTCDYFRVTQIFQQTLYCIVVGSPLLMPPGCTAA